MPPRHTQTKADVIRKTVHETLLGLGFDLSEPSELQADMHYLRGIRRGSEDMRKLVKNSIITLLVSTGLYLLWEAVRAVIKRDF